MTGKSHSLVKAGLLHSKDKRVLLLKKMPTNKTNILSYLSNIPDNRRGAGQRHSQEFILLLTIMSTMSGYYGYRSIGDFIERNRRALIHSFKPNKNRLPTFYTVRRVLQEIDFNIFSKQFHEWSSQYITITKSEWVSIDGKAIKGTMTAYSSSEQKFVSLISLYCSKQKLVLGNAQLQNAKASEIPVVRHLIESLDLKGVTFTLDALHCQKKQQKPL